MSLSPSYSPSVWDNEISAEHEQSRLHENLGDPYLVDNDAVVKSFYFTQDLNAPNIPVIKTASQKHATEKTKEKKTKSANMKKSKKYQFSSKTIISENSSYIIRKEPGKAHHLINITIHDMSDNASGMSRKENDSARVSVQYLVRNNCDEIMDETEHLIGKIVKKINL